MVRSSKLQAEALDQRVLDDSLVGREALGLARQSCLVDQDACQHVGKEERTHLFEVLGRLVAQGGPLRVAERERPVAEGQADSGAQCERDRDGSRADEEPPS
jgi:hypothetical protein